MGKLLSLLARDESTCCTPQKYEVFLDFESKFAQSNGEMREKIDHLDWFQMPNLRTPSVKRSKLFRES